LLHILEDLIEEGLPVDAGEFQLATVEIVQDRVLAVIV